MNSFLIFSREYTTGTLDDEMDAVGTSAVNTGQAVKKISWPSQPWISSDVDVAPRSPFVDAGDVSPSRWMKKGNPPEPPFRIERRERRESISHESVESICSRRSWEQREAGGGAGCCEARMAKSVTPFL